MGAGLRIHFFVDEHFPVNQLRTILEPRGHAVTQVDLSSKDLAILATAEEIGTIVITADTWFMDELFRFPPGHRNCFQRTGVIQLPGTWAAARLRLTTYLPVIEVLAEVRSAQPDRRVAIDLSRRVIRIPEP
jgi:hypothetical protein